MQALPATLQRGDGPPADRLPALAVVPGGSTNVFARALGLPRDWVEGTGVILEGCGWAGSARWAWAGPTTATSRSAPASGWTRP